MKRLLFTVALMMGLSAALPLQPVLGNPVATTLSPKDYVIDQVAKYSRGEITGKFKPQQSISIGQDFTVQQGYYMALYVVNNFGVAAANWWLESYGLDWIWLQLAYSDQMTWNWPMSSLAPGN